jgi:two-component system phosphate regulon sensor histidine kinase PhoR
VIAVALAALAALAVGAMVEPAWGWATLAVLLLAILGYHLRHMHALARWLDRGDSPDPPRAYGFWDDLHALLHRSRRESTTREAQLIHALKRWEQAARALPEGVVILEQDRIDWLNDMAQVHLQIDGVKDVGRPIMHIVRIPEFAAYLQAGDFTKPVIVESDERVISIQVVPYGDSQRLVLSRDITQFRRVDRMRREFVANVSHEMRTPLTVVSGFIETLRGETDAGAVDRYLDLMGEQSGRMQRLVEDLLTLSALESAPPPPLDEVVPMGPLVDRLAAEARAPLRGTPSHPGGGARPALRPDRQRQGARERIRQPREQRDPLQPPRAARSRCAGARPGKALLSKSRTRGSASTPSTSRGSPSASIVSTGAARARPAARGSGSPS